MAPIAQSGLSWGQKCCFLALAAASRPAVQRGQHKNVVFLLSDHDGNKKVGRFWQKNGFWAKKLHFRPEILHFFKFLAAGLKTGKFGGKFVE